jgi:predicted nucleic acid-binding protein
MAAKYFVDTNILIYAHDRRAGEKHERAREVIERLWNTGEGVLSTQVLQELCINLRRKVAVPLSTKEIRNLVRDYMAWDVVVNGPVSILEALDVQERYDMSFWDALILQAANSSGATTLYSEDLADGQKYGTVRVVNPLKT